VIVVDASTLTDVLLGRAVALDALDELLDGREHEPLHAPELVELEVLNALRGLLRGRKIDVLLARAAIRDLSDMRLVCYPHAPLRERIWELRDALSAYDASYLALAEVLPGATLASSDRPVVTVGRRLLGSDRVRYTG
jgi:predicted nucleic acid-binding protein